MTSNIINLRYVDDIDAWLKVPNNCYIGRPTKWGNPYKLKNFNNREEVVTLYEKYVRENKNLVEAARDLKGKTLGCWCAPDLCHGETLHKLAGNQPIYQSASKPKEDIVGLANAVNTMSEATLHTLATVAGWAAKDAMETTDTTSNANSTLAGGATMTKEILIKNLGSNVTLKDLYQLFGFAEEEGGIAINLTTNEDKATEDGNTAVIKAPDTTHDSILQQNGMELQGRRISIQYQDELGSSSIKSTENIHNQPNGESQDSNDQAGRACHGVGPPSAARRY